MTSGLTGGKRPVPGADVLNICFHGIGTPQRSVDQDEAVYWVGVSAYLRILDEIATWPSVAISFDDANASDIQAGLPALAERGLTATFFVLAGRLGSPGSLASGDVRELTRHDMTVGSHGMSHRSWRAMGPADRQAELVEARQVIEDASGHAVTQAACPMGRYDRRLLADLRRLGYPRVYTSDRRPAGRGSWLQPRFSVRQGDTPESLRATVLARPAAARRARLSLTGVAKRVR
jgi:peptidoglycan/xylan/chitin deacetylase (PgdA/CDA1 family)